MKKSLKYLLLIILVLPIFVIAVTIDKNAPVITSISFGETKDLKPYQRVYLDAKINDDVSGVATIDLSLRKVSEKPESGTNKINYNARAYYDSFGKLTFNIPYNCPTGEYYLYGVSLTDKAGNSKTYYTIDGAKGLVASVPKVDSTVKFNIVSDVNDITGPELTSFKSDKNEINLGESFNFEVVANDNTSVSSVRVILNNKNQEKINVDLEMNDDGKFVAQYTPSNITGTYLVEEVIIYDSYNNFSRHINDKFYETENYCETYKDLLSKDAIFCDLDETYIKINNNGVVDKIAPTLESVKINKTSFQLPSYATIEIIAKDNAGLSSTANVVFENAQGKEITASLKLENGVYKGVLDLNQHLDLGKYYLTKVKLEDVSGNRASLYNDKYAINEYYKKTGELNTEIEINLTSKFTSDVTTSTVSKNILKDITEAKENAKISIDATTVPTLTKEVFENIKSTNKSIYVESNGIMWIFEGQDIKNPKDINTSLLVSYGTYDDSISNYTDKALILDFADNGELPGKATIILKLDYALKDYIGDDVYLYYYKEEGNENRNFENILNDSLKPNENGYFEFSISHNSRYVLSAKKIDSKYVVPLNTTSSNNNILENIKSIDHINLYIAIIAIVFLIISLIIFVIYLIKTKKNKTTEKSIKDIKRI